MMPGFGSGATYTYAEHMEAYDLLPPAIREVLQEMPFKVAAVELLGMYLRRGEAVVLSKLAKAREKALLEMARERAEALEL
jgi:hypothetical protein